MEHKKTKKDSGILKAFESIQSENERLQTILHDMMFKRKKLEANLDSVENDLFSLNEKYYAVQAETAITCMKLQEIEDEISKSEEAEKTMTENINKMNENIKERKDAFDIQIDKLTVEVERLCSHYLFLFTKNENVQEDCLKNFENVEELKQEILEKESHLADIKRKLDECVYYTLPENPLEQVLETSDRQQVMESMEEELFNYKKQLEELNKIKEEKVLSEKEAIQNI